MSCENYNKVKDFTEQSGYPVPAKPTRFTKTEVEFIIKMVMDECSELYNTIAEPDEDVINSMKGLLGANYKKTPVPDDEVDLITEQADALVDINYYVYNAAAKHGMNIDAVFNIVHEANMAKRFPDGKFHKDHLGKIIKPPGWAEGDVKAEIIRQME